MIAATNQCQRSALFTEIHLTVVALYVEVAVDEGGTLSESAPKRFLSVQVDVAMAVGGGAVQRIIGALEVATVVC